VNWPKKSPEVEEISGLLTVMIRLIQKVCHLVTMYREKNQASFQGLILIVDLEFWLQELH